MCDKVQINLSHYDDLAINQIIDGSGFESLVLHILELTVTFANNWVDPGFTGYSGIHFHHNMISCCNVIMGQ